MIPIPLSWGGRQPWGVNQKKRRRPPPPTKLCLTSQCSPVPLCSSTLFTAPVSGSPTSNASSQNHWHLLHAPPTYVFVSFIIYHRCPECWEARWEIGYWTFAPAPLLPNFGGNGNFHILAEIENIKCGNRLVEYCLYAEESDAILQMVTLKWLTLDISNRTCGHII